MRIISPTVLSDYMKKNLGQMIHYIKNNYPINKWFKIVYITIMRYFNRNILLYS